MFVARNMKRPNTAHKVIPILEGTERVLCLGTRGASCPRALAFISRSTDVQRIEGIGCKVTIMKKMLVRTGMIGGECLKCGRKINIAE